MSWTKLLASKEAQRHTTSFALPVEVDKVEGAILIDQLKSFSGGPARLPFFSSRIPQFKISGLRSAS